MKHNLMFSNILQKKWIIRYAVKQKKRYYLGIFPKRQTPPPTPLLGTPYPKKYEICNMKYEI